MNPFSPVRPSPIAGSWYSANPNVLRDQINGYLDQAASTAVVDEVVGLIAPHAGYYYSGLTAAHAYNCVRGRQYDVCVIFSPLHEYLPYNLLTSAYEAYATPLGRVKVDGDLLAACSAGLQKTCGETLKPIANDSEHSLEIQLPFLQTVLGSPFTLLPIMVRSHDPLLLEMAAQAIAEVLRGQKALLVASTDLSHFYSEAEAAQLDDHMLTHMATFSPGGVLKAEKSGEGFACGAGAVALMLWTCQCLGARQVTLLHQSTSADATGESQRVVGYGALAVTR